MRSNPNNNVFANCMMYGLHMAAVLLGFVMEIDNVRMYATFCRGFVKVLLFLLMLLRSTKNAKRKRTGFSSKQSAQQTVGYIIFV